jgi:type II secretory pathway predicted ATPase ExeA
MTSKLEVLVQCGFVRDPFRALELETADGARLRQVLTMAVDARSLVSIVGERGVGKSLAVSKVLHQAKVRQVRVLGADKGRITAGDIQEAMILDLSDESPRKSKETRSRQLRRILGEASRRQAVVVVIEEAHRLHSQTLRSIKNLRELDWMGESQLFAVILVGQSDCVQKAGLAEVRLRTETVHMHGLTAGEVREYVAGTVGARFEPGAVEAVAAHSGARNYLDLQELLIGVLADGRDQATARDVALCLGQTPKDLAVPVKDAGAGKQALRSVLERRRGQDGEAGAKAAG